MPVPAPTGYTTTTGAVPTAKSSRPTVTANPASMKLDRATIEELAVRPGMPATLDARSTESTKVDWLGATKAEKRKEMAEEDLRSFVDELEASQELLWANATHALLVVRVHPELLSRGGPLPGKGPANNVWQDRYEDINAFERHLHRNGTRVVKIFLHVSKELQKRRFLERLDDPDKYWKFSAADLAERGHWDDYMAAYEEALTATSTAWAPWYVVPADHKYTLRALVGGIVVHTIDEMDLPAPQVAPDGLQALARAKAELLAE